MAINRKQQAFQRADVLFYALSSNISGAKPLNSYGVFHCALKKSPLKCIIIKHYLKKDQGIWDISKKHKEWDTEKFIIKKTDPPNPIGCFSLLFGNNLIPQSSICIFFSSRITFFSSPLNRGKFVFSLHKIAFSYFWAVLYTVENLSHNVSLKAHYSSCLIHRYELRTWLIFTVVKTERARRKEKRKEKNGEEKREDFAVK